MVLATEATHCCIVRIKVLEMVKIFLLSKAEVFIKILHTISSFSDDEDNREDDSISQFAEIPLPSFNYVLKTIEKEYIGNEDILKLFDLIGFSFPYYPKLIRNLIQSKKADSYISERAVKIIFSTFVSWYAYFLISHDTEYFSTILESLLLIATNRSLNNKKDYKCLGACAFYYSSELLMFYPDNLSLSEMVFQLDMFFFRISDLDSKFFDLFLPISNIVYQEYYQNNKITYEELMVVISSLYHHYGVMFPSNIMETIVNMFQKPIMAFDIPSLKFLSQCITCLSSSSIESFFDGFIISVTSMSKDYVHIPEKCIIHEPVYNKRYDIQFSKSLNYSFFKSDFSLSQFNMESEYHTSKEISLLMLIDDSFNKQLEMLSTALSVSKEVSSKFVSFLIEKSKGLFMRNVRVFFSIILILKRMLPWNIDSINTIEFFENSHLFDPELCFIQFSGEDIYIKSLREISIDICSIGSPEAFLKFFQSNISSPMFIYEICDRLIQTYDSIPESLVGDLSETILCCFNNYRDFVYRKGSFNEFSPVLSSLIVLFDKIISISKNMDVCFSRSGFLSQFFFLFYEHHNLEARMKYLRLFLSETRVFQSIFFKEMKEFLSPLFIIDSNFSRFDIISRIIILINDEIAINPFKAVFFAGLSDFLCQKSLQLPISSKSEDLLLLIVSFLALTSHEHTINVNELLAIETAILRICKNNPSIIIMNKLVHVIAGRQLSIEVYDFEIYQPKVLCLFLEIFVRTDLVSNALDILYKLCYNNVNNCEKCHQGNLDMYILEKIWEFRNDRVVNDSLIRQFLDLFIIIAKTSSSVTVVHKFLSLLCPINGMNIPIYKKSVMQALNRLFESRNLTPLATYHFGQGSSVLIDGLTGSMLSNGFTVSFWVYFNLISQKSSLNLFTICDSSGNFISAQILGNKLEIIVSNVNVYSGTFNIDISPKSWNLLSLTFEPANNQEVGIRITLYINDSLLKSVTKFGDIFVDQTNLKLIIENNSLIDSYDSVLSLGPFSMSLVVESIEFLIKQYEKGPRTLITSQNSVFSYEFLRKNSELTTKNIAFSQLTNCSIINPKAKSDSDFASILIYQSNINSLIPLFGHADLVDLNGMRESDSLCFAVDLLNNAFKLGDYVQESFNEIHGFKAISHLLMSSSCDSFNHKVYKRFINLCESIHNHELLLDLFDNIILRIDLWSKCSVSDFDQITKHWSSSEFILGVGFLKKIRPIGWILSYIQYSSIFSDGNYIKKEYCSVVKNLISVLDIYISGTFEEEEFLNGIIFQLFSTQHKIVYNFALDFILRCVKDIKNLDVMKLIRNNINTLVMPPIYNNSDTLEKLIKIVLYSFSQDTNIKQQLDLWLTVIVFKHLVYFSDKILFNSLLNLMNDGFPELFSLVSWMALRIQSNCVEMLLNTIDRSLLFQSGFYSTLWISLCCFYYSGNDLIVFIVDQFRCKIHEIVYIISSFGFSSNQWEKANDIIYKLLFRCSELYIDNMYPKQDIDNYLKIAKEFMFLNSLVETTGRQDYSYGWKYLHSHSPFSEKDSIYANEKYLIDFSVPLGVIGKYLVEPDYSNTFSIRFKQILEPCFRSDSADIYEWADKSLAYNVLRIIGKHYSNINPKINEIVLIAGFLKISKKELSEILGQNISQQFQNEAAFVDFCYFKSNLLNIDQSTAIFLNMRKYSLTCDYFAFINKIFSRDDSQVSLLNSIRNRTSDIEMKKDLIHTKVNTMSKNEHEFNETNKYINVSNKKIWIGLWRSLSSDGAPWNEALPIDSRSTPYFKRDYNHCNFCPMKMKRNYQFDDHKIAAISRDSGDISYAQQKVQDILATRSATINKSVFNIPDSYDEDIVGGVEFVENNLKPLFAHKCDLLRPNSKTNASMIINMTSINIIKSKGKIIVIRRNQIQHIMWRPLFHRIEGIEIFCFNGKNYLLDLKIHPQEIISVLVKTFSLNKPGMLIQTSDFASFVKNSGITEKWVNREMSTFDYILHLNIMGGRSFNSPPQYPFFPWIIAEYTSEILDYDNPGVFRDLSIPVGMLTPHRLADLRTKYKELINMNVDPYNYSNGFVYPLSVYLYLLRVEPFTTLHVDIQGGRFDHAARLFLSIRDTYKLISQQSGDYRELIPEFFYSPEFLKNHNGFDLGTVGGNIVSDVELPIWSKDCYEFIYLHRKALESEHVSKTINNWIDLMWGIKQKSPDNLYKKQMYSDIWNDKNNTKDEFKKIDIEVTLEQIGQIPYPLFFEPHPVRGPKTIDECSICNIDDLILFNNHVLVDSFLQQSGKHLHVIALTSNDLFLDSILSLDNYENSQIVLGIFNQIDTMKQKTIINNSQIMFYNEKNSCLFIASIKKEIQSYQIHTEVLFYVVSKQWIVVAGSDTNIILIDMYSNSTKSIRSYRDVAKCICVNEGFDLFVFGTRDCSLAFCSLNRGDIVRIAKLNGSRPQRVIISKSFGYVIVEATRKESSSIVVELLLFSINGEYIKRTLINHRIIAWDTWKNNSGFDYLVTLDEFGEIALREVFFIDQIIMTLPKVNMINSEVINLTVLKEESAVLIVHSNGKVDISPFQIPGV